MSDNEKEGREHSFVTPGPNEENTKPAPGSESPPSNGGQPKPVSPLRSETSRINGKHSQGPTTPEGKARSSQNSRKHGFFARQPLPPGEEGARLWKEYSDLVAGIWEYYRPVGYMEELLTEKIATESIRFSRLMAFESKYAGEPRAFCWEGVDRVLRFQSAINRQLFQAMRELERLQDKRRGEVSPSKGSDPAPEHGNVGPPGGVDGPDRGPKVGPAPGETSEICTYEIPDPSQWQPLAPSFQPQTVTRQRTSQPSSQVQNYGTNPTGATSSKPDSGTSQNAPRPAKHSLADLATQKLGLPPAEGTPDSATTSREQGKRREHDSSEQEEPYRSKFIAPGDQALFDSVQESIRKHEDEDEPL